MRINSVGVYAGSSSGNQPEYTEAAQNLGRELAQRGITINYGGGNVGLMGALATASLAAGGKIIGVIPKAMEELGLGYEGLTQLQVVESMHDRKRIIADLSDAFIALPGGFGTVEEIFEILTWAQLRYHTKPAGFLNTCGYYNSLMQFIRNSVQSSFVHQEHEAMVALSDDPKELLSRFESYSAPTVEKAHIQRP